MTVAERPTAAAEHPRSAEPAARRAARTLRQPGVLALIAALAASFVIYYPSLTAPFYGDDYVYRWAIQEHSTWDYVKASVEPLSRDQYLLFTDTFYRPLYFLAFPVLDWAFGDDTFGYHLVLLVSHLAAVVLVWLLALRLTGRDLVAGVAAVAFALHPSGTEAVAWISSLNSAALPLMLGAWLAFIAAVRAEGRRKRVALLVLTGLLAAAALGFRETAVGLMGAIGAWYLLVEKRHALLDWRTYPPLLPFVVAVGVFFVLRTRLFTEPYANSMLYNWGGQSPGNLAFLIRQGPTPFDTTAGGLKSLIGVGAGTLTVVIFIGAVITRRWLLIALILGMFAAILPFGPFTLAVLHRYFYLAAALQALALGVLVAEAGDVLRRRQWPARAPAALAGLAVLAAVLFIADGNAAVRAFNENSPEAHQAFVDRLRSTYTELPEGGTLYAVDPPFILAVFNAYILDTTVRMYYPEVGKVEVVYSTDPLPELGPNDRLFFAR